MSFLKIGADTSDAKKEILGLQDTTNKFKPNKIQLFDKQEREFIEKDLNKQLGLVGDMLKANKKEVDRLMDAQMDVVEGSKKELEIKKELYKRTKEGIRLEKERAQISKSLGENQYAGSARGKVSGISKGIGGTLGKLGLGLAAGTAAAGALGIGLGIDSTKQYMAGAPVRTQAAGLGLDGDTSLDKTTLAEAGLTEQELASRKVAAGRLGRDLGDEQTLLQQARFERAYGLDDGTMTNISGSLRSSFGDQTNQVQQELQASVFASGMEDAIGPYLETMASLLSNINENGLAATDQLIRAMGDMAANSGRTPEQLARTFTNINDAVSGASGESNAFLQAAFARGGIGGGTVGGTRFALESGGITGLDREKFADLGLGGKGLQDDLQDSGFFGNFQDRSKAILDQLQKSAGIEDLDNFSGEQAAGLSNLANKVFGTKGLGGLEAVSALKGVQDSGGSQEDFKKKLEEIKEGANPQIERLDMVNKTLSGQTDVLLKINENIRAALGRTLTGEVGNKLLDAKNQVDGARGAVQQEAAGGVGGVVGGIQSATKYLFGGGLGEDIYDMIHGEGDSNEGKVWDSTAKQYVSKTEAPGVVSKDNLPGTKREEPGKSAGMGEKEAVAIGKQLSQSVREGFAGQRDAAKQRTKTVNKIKIMNPGSVTNKTYETK